MGQKLSCACATGSGRGDSDAGARGEELEDPVQDILSVSAALASSGGGANAAIVEDVDARYVHSVGVVRTNHTEGENTDDDFIELTMVDWMDWFIRQLWPHFEKMIQNVARTKIEPEIDKELDKYGVAGRAFKGVKFTRCELGHKRPVVGPVRAYRKSHQDYHGIEIDCDMKLDCEPFIQMTIGGMSAGIKRLKFEGTVSVIMKPFVEVAPIVGGAQVFLMNRPKLQFELSGALNAVNSSIIHRVLEKIVLDQITQSFVLPSRVHLNILKEWQLKADMVSLLSPVPEGIVRVRVVSASNLPASDIHLEDLKDIKGWMAGRRTTLGTVSDPFCEVQIGSKIFRTETVERTVNPIWTNGATGDFLIYNLAQDVLVRVFDNDFGLSGDDVLGTASLSVGALLRSREITVPLVEREPKSKAENDTDITEARGEDRIGNEKASQKPQVCMRVEYFALREPTDVNDFTRFRLQHEGPSEALLGVKIFGLRSIGHRSSASDVAGKTLRVTLHGHDGSTTSCSSKPSRLRGSHFEMDGVEPATMRIARNLRALHPNMPLEEIAAATELDVSVAQGLLDMSELCPVQVNAGFFFCVHSHKDDVCFVEVLPTKKTQAHKAIVSFQIPVSEIAAEQGMILKKCFVLRWGELHPMRKSPKQVQSENLSTSFLQRSKSSTFARMKSSMGLARSRSFASANNEETKVDGLPTVDEKSGQGNDHSDQQANSTNSDGMPRGEQVSDMTDMKVEIDMELRLYSMFPSRRS